MVQKSRYWAFVMYPDSMPENWLSILNEYHLPMAISPLHDADLNADGEEKKAHYHVLLVYGNTTTASNIAKISESVNGTIPIPVMSLKGYYRYLTHKDNPEKHQYNDKDIKHISGFDPLDYWSLSAEEETHFITDIIRIIEENKIHEYRGLLLYLMGYDLALLKYACKHTILFKAYLDSFRNMKKDKNNN